MPHLVTPLNSQVKDEVYVYSHAGNKVVRLAEDFVGAAHISGREKHSWLFVTLSGFTSPGTVGRYDFTAPEEQRWNIYRTTKVKGLNTDDFEASQVRLSLPFLTLHSPFLGRYGMRAKTAHKCQCLLSATNPPNSMVPLRRYSTVSNHLIALECKYICQSPFRLRRI